MKSGLPRYLKIFVAVSSCCASAALIYLVNLTFEAGLSAPSIFSTVDFVGLSKGQVRELKQNASRINLQLDDIDKILKIIGPFERKISLTIISEQNFSFNRDGLIVPASLVGRDGQLALAVLRVWVNQHFNDSDPVAQLALADFLWSVAHSGYLLDTPSGAAMLSTNKNLLSSLMNTSEFLISPWLPTEKYAFIANRVSLADDHSPNIFSLRPLLLVNLIESFQKLGMEEQFSWLKRLASQAFMPRSLISSSKSLRLEDIRNIPSQLVHFLGLPSVLGPDLKIQLLAEGLNKNILGDQPIIVNNEGKFILYPGQVALEEEDVLELHFTYLVSFQLSLDNFEITTQTPYNVDKVVVILPNAPVLAIDRLASGDLKSFLARNLNLPLAVFDLDSLKLAQKKALIPKLKSWLNEKTHFKMAGSSDPRDLLGITHASWNKVTHTFQIDGAIEAVEYWRPNFLIQ